MVVHCPGKICCIFAFGNWHENHFFGLIFFCKGNFKERKFLEKDSLQQVDSFF